jgi:hypothetical protein
MLATHITNTVTTTNYYQQILLLPQLYTLMQSTREAYYCPLQHQHHAVLREQQQYMYATACYAHIHYCFLF